MTKKIQRIQWARDFNPKNFDIIVDEYVVMKGVNKRTAQIVISRQLGILLASGVIERVIEARLMEGL